MKAKSSNPKLSETMRKTYLAIAMIASIALASCESEVEDVNIRPDDSGSAEITIPGNREQITFKAVHQNGDGISKTAIVDKTCLHFTAGDEINVFDGDKSCVFTGDIKEGTSATCNFSGSANPDAETYYAVYPSSASLDASKVSGSIPTSQTAVAGTFDKNAHVMVASASGSKKEFAFKTANAFIRIIAPRNLKSIVMTGNNNEAIAGDFTILGYSDFTVSGATESSITLSGTMEKENVYYISYIPANFTDGIKLTITDEDKFQVTYTTKAFLSKPNQVNTISVQKLDNLFSSKKMSSEELSGYLESFTGEVASVFLETFEKDVVVSALKDNININVKLILPESVKEIESNTFKECSNLVSIEMPGVTKIGENAFSGCSNLALTSLPSGVTMIGESAFSGCSNLALTSLPSGVTEIDNYAFMGCEKLPLVSLPNSVESIGIEAFSGCSNLALTSLPDGIIDIGDRAFYECTELAITSIPDKVTSIADEAFFGCTSLEEISIPPSVQKLGNNFLHSCSNLKTIRILGNPLINDEGECDDYKDCPDGTKIYITRTFYETNRGYWDKINESSNVTVYVENEKL